MLQKIDKGFGRVIIVDLITPKGEVPLGFETEGPSIAYRVMPYGGFGIRISTPEATEIEIQLDGTTLLETVLEPGVHELRKGKNGSPFVFTKPGATKLLPAAIVDTREAEATVGDTTEPERPARPKRELAPSHGLVIVSLRVADVKPEHAPQLPPDDYTDLLFQMNTWPDHSKAYAAQLQTVVVPEVPEGEQFELSADGRSIPVHRPHFNCGHAQ